MIGTANPGRADQSGLFGSVVEHVHKLEGSSPDRGLGVLVYGADSLCCSVPQGLARSPILRWQAAGRLNRSATVCMAHSAVPPARGLYDPAEDKDACGVGFVGELDHQPTRQCVQDALEMLRRMAHRGACGCDANTGQCSPAAGLRPSRMKLSSFDSVF